VLRQFHESLVEAEIRLLEATSEVELLELENSDIVQRVREKEAEIKNLGALKAKYTNDHNALVNTANAAMKNVTDKQKIVIDKYRTLPTVEDLDNKIEGNDARLQMMAEGNPNAIRMFQRREQDIRETDERLAEIRMELAEAKEKIVEIRGQWEPELDALVAKISDGFSHNFEGIGCAGQVGVYKDEDFEAWSIQIQVRFR
jgi:chromosome segregation ATPase